jgi:hypothetical protein
MADARDERDHGVPVQEGLEVTDIALIDGALWQNHDVDGSCLLASGRHRTANEVQVEALRRCELEQPGGLAV